MPLTAFLETDPATRDLRRAARRKLCLGSRLAGSGAEVLIHDLSSTGLRIETSADLGIGDTLAVEIPEAGASEASIIWRQGRFFGCEFRHPISPAAISAATLRGLPARVTDLRLKVHGDYQASGYAHIERLVPAEVTQALLKHYWRTLLDGKVPFIFKQNPLLTKPAMELHGSKFPAVTTFLWGLTPTVSELAKCDLLPTYAFFRLYQNGDTLRVHKDRNACEHSLSLTLGYSDEQPWAFDIGHADARPDSAPADDFGEEPFSTIAMLPGDAVLYRGIRRRHGRLTPNPNKWSAHLFLHWVDRDGPYRKHAFERWPDKPTPGD